MAVRITHIFPKSDSVSADKIAAHLSIENFKWINEQDFQIGTTPLVSMFDWIVNNKGVAYVKKGDTIIPVLGAVSKTGKKYIRCLKDGTWSDELLELPSIN